MTKAEVISLLHAGWDPIPMPEESQVFNEKPRGEEYKSAYDLFAGRKWSDVDFTELSMWTDTILLGYLDHRADYYAGGVLLCMLDQSGEGNWPDILYYHFESIFGEGSNDRLHLNRDQITAVVALLEYLHDEKWIWDDASLVDTINESLAYWQSELQ